MTRLAIGITLALLGGVAGRAAAQNVVVVVAPLEGDRGHAARDTLVSRLEGTVTLVDPARAAGEARRAGAAIGDPLVLRALGADGVVEGRVRRAGPVWLVEVEVRDAQGNRVGGRTLRARRSRPMLRRLRRWASTELVELVAALPPPLASAPVAEAAPRLEAARPEGRPPRAEARAGSNDAQPPSGRAPFTLEAGLALTHRALTYRDDLFSRLRGYTMPAAPFLQLAARWFPAAHADQGPLAGLGVVARGALGLALDSRGANGVAFPTQAWAVDAGLRYRLPVDDVVLHAEVGYQAHHFAIADADGGRIAPDVPSVELHSVRTGVGLRWEVGAFLFFDAEWAYLAPFVVHGITGDDWFPRASVGGVETMGGLGLRFGDFAVAARFEWKRFFYAMNTEPGDTRIAGGALDDNVAGTLRASWTPR